jgi:hypothetical protein
MRRPDGVRSCLQCEADHILKRFLAIYSTGSVNCSLLGEDEMDGIQNTISARLEVQRGAPPAGDAIFVSTDSVGNPGALRDGVLRQLGVPSSEAPRAKQLVGGYAIIQDANNQLICFIVTVGRGPTGAELTRNLANCLLDEQLREARKLWIPLMGTGVGGLSNDQSVAAILDSLRKVGLLQRTELAITISAPPGITDPVLSRLQASLAALIDPRPSAEVLPLDEEVESVLSVAGDLGPGRTNDNHAITTSLLLFALCESRNSLAPAILQASKEATAFADAVHQVAGLSYKNAWQSYFRADFVYTPLTTNETAALSPNASKVLALARRAAKNEGRGRVSVANLALALLDANFGRYRRTLAQMDLGVDGLRLAFHQLLSPSQIAATLINDLATAEDGLGYNRYARAIARFLTHPNTRGPVSVSIQAPWGAGKSSLMRLIRRILDRDEVERVERIARTGVIDRSSATVDRLTLGTVISFLNRRRSGDVKRRSAPSDQRWTIWFNAWKYESSDQVWAGLVDAIVSQVADRLGPIDREMFLLKLNLARIDDNAVRRKIYERVVTVWWGRVRRWLLTAVGGIATLVGFEAVPKDTIPGWTSLAATLPLMSHAGLGLEAAAVVQLAVSVYVVVAYFGSRRHVDEEPASFSLAEYIRVPDYGKTIGTIHQIHDDLMRVLRVVPGRYDPVLETTEPQPLVIFIDDLDRCSPSKVASAVEGVNTFLASDLYQCMFVIGMDPQVVAAALEHAHRDVRERLPFYERTVPLGWRFMDKFIQLPFTIPPCDPLALSIYIDKLVPIHGAPRSLNSGSGEAGNNGGGVHLREVGGQAVENSHFQLTASDTRTEGPETQKKSEKIQDELSWELSDESEDVRAMMIRMAADFPTNPREIKRLLNVVRLHLLLRIGRIANGKPVPDLAQYQRWITLALKWPDMMRWLQWSPDPLASRPSDPRQTNVVAGRLKRIEEQAGKDGSVESWEAALADIVGTNGTDASETKVVWMNDPSLLTFFKRETELADFAERLSTGAETGYY